MDLCDRTIQGKHREKNGRTGKFKRKVPKTLPMRKIYTLCKILTEVGFVMFVEYGSLDQLQVKMIPKSIEKVKKK